MRIQQVSKQSCAVACCCMLLHAVALLCSLFQEPRNRGTASRTATSKTQCWMGCGVGAATQCEWRPPPPPHQLWRHSKSSNQGAEPNPLVHCPSISSQAIGKTRCRYEVKVGPCFRVRSALNPRFRRSTRWALEWVVHLSSAPQIATLLFVLLRALWQPKAFCPAASTCLCLLAVAQALARRTIYRDPLDPVSL